VQRQKCLVELVGLDHEEILACHPSIAAPGTHPATGNAGRVEAGGRESLGGHDRGSGLPVGTRNPDCLCARDQLGERRLAGHNRQSQSSSPL
jgi:hypothetical protein